MGRSRLRPPPGANRATGSTAHQADPSVVSGVGFFVVQKIPGSRRTGKSVNYRGQNTAQATERVQTIKFIQSAGASGSCRIFRKASGCRIARTALVTFSLGLM